MLYILVLSAVVFALPVQGQELAESVQPEAVDTVAVATADTVVPVELTYPQILIDMPNVHVHQDSIVTQLMEEKIAGVERGEQERAGFRVQIYSSNNPQRGKSEALRIEQRVKESLTVPVYVIYASPSWKVRLGDFLNEQQAAELRDALKEMFPDLADYTYIVRDQVKIR